MQNIIVFAILPVFCGLAYRLGGIGKPFNTKFRDWGCPACAFLSMWALNINTEFWWSLVTFFAMWGAFATYWDKWGTEAVEWFEWMITGFFYGMALLPIAMYTGKYLGFIIRTVILTIFMPFSNKFQIKVVWDRTDGVEFSRGFVYNITIPLLLL